MISLPHAIFHSIALLGNNSSNMSTTCSKERKKTPQTRMRKEIVLGVVASVFLIFDLGIAQNSSINDAYQSPPGKCFKIVDPAPGYVLSLEDHVSMSFILRINCPGDHSTYSNPQTAPPILGHRSTTRILQN